ncbi:hypothetical protein XU19_12000 [Vibrio parahaemolyticus]|nr:hypothetical protein XU19_12000 [Vibrio parahaemolyticus]KKY43847.1 hypothetical protein AAY51_05345 [Vibrio parahaemolyticus]KOP91992.1 hypothetical protein AL012_20980 [Citrobacter amalonaticus]KOP94366.1 hypothetical protein ALC61_16610 [Citrobacter amalonaticus]
MALIFGGIHSTINICVLIMVREGIPAVGRIERGLQSFLVVKVKQLMTHGQLMAMVLAKK